MACEGGFMLVVYLSGGAKPLLASIIPGNPTFSRGPPLVVMVFRGKVTVVQVPVWGDPTTIGSPSLCFLRFLNGGRWTPRVRGQNFEQESPPLGNCMGWRY